MKRAKRFLDYLFVIGQDAARNGLFLKILIAAIGPANNPLRTILGCSFNTKKAYIRMPLKNPLATWFRASTPYRIQLLLFVVAVLVALLPASVIYYLLLMIAGGVVIFTLYKVFHQSLLAATLLLIAGVILVLPLMLIGIMGVVLIIAIYPTMLNLWASWLIAGFTKNNRFRILCVIPIAIILGLNYRLLYLLPDMAIGADEIVVIRPIELAGGEALGVKTNVDNISWRERPADTLSIGSNEGCMCAYWEYPRQDGEGLRDQLRRAGLRYRMDVNSAKRLEMNAKEVDGVLKLELAVWDGENKTAYYRGKFRQGYGPENEVLGHKASLDSFDHRVLYLSQNNIWNWLLGIKTEQRTPIRDFLSKAIKSSTTQNPNWPSLQSEGVVATFLGKVETVSTSEKKSQGKIFNRVFDGCDGLIEVGSRYNRYRSRSGHGISLVGTTLTWKSNGEEYTNVIPDIEFIQCTDKYVYALSPLYRIKVDSPERYDLRKYSLKGDMLNHVIANLQGYTPRGVPRRPLTGFRETDDGYEFEMHEFAPDKFGGYEHIGASRWRIPKSVATRACSR